MSFFQPHIDALAGYMPGEQPQAGKFIKLNTNENPYPPAPAVRQAILGVLDRGLEKYPDPMATSFRIRAAQVLGVEPDWIFCGNGSDEILTILTRSMVGPGQLLRLPYPSYILYKTLAEIQNARSEEVRFNADWTLPAVFGQGKDDLRLVMLPNPNSPSGTFIAPDEVLEFARSLPCPLLVDEAYADFAEDNCVRLVRECDKIMVSRTLSKSYSLAGLRFGFLVAQPHVIANLIKVKDSYNCDSLSIAAATAAIDDQPHLAANRAKIIASRSRLEGLARELGFTPVPSQANFVWCPHPTQSAKAMYETLKAQRILVRYMNYAGWGDGLRISVGTDDQIDACMGILQDFRS